MNIKENIRIAIFSIKTNLMRSLLTMLGIIIGVASVIAVITVGNGGRDYIVGMIRDMGNSAISLTVNTRTADDEDYFTNITTTCFENVTDIDDKISSSLKNWTIDRISKVNLSILRLAVCEIMYIEDIPFQVSINEAVELAKKYSDDDAPSFVNGVLASII